MLLQLVNKLEELLRDPRHDRGGNGVIAFMKCGQRQGSWDFYQGKEFDASQKKRNSKEIKSEKNSNEGNGSLCMWIFKKRYQVRPG